VSFRQPSTIISQCLPPKPLPHSRPLASNFGPFGSHNAPKTNFWVPWAIKIAAKGSAAKKRLKNTGVDYLLFLIEACLYILMSIAASWQTVVYFNSVPNRTGIIYHTQLLSIVSWHYTLFYCTLWGASWQGCWRSWAPPPGSPLNF